MASHPEKTVIPKIIHYIWFGKADEPIANINAWHALLPGYDIRRWTETDFDLRRYEFARRAYDEGRYGIAIDPFRAIILCEHGGIWLDTDMIIHKDFTEYLQYSFFIGYESECNFSAGLIGVAPHHPLLSKIVAWYGENWSKCGEAIEFAYRSRFTSPMVFTRLFTKEYGIVPDGFSKTLATRDGAVRLEAPPVFTIRGDYGITNYAEHLYDGSWLNKKSDFYKEVVDWYENRSKM
jgi:AraC-like DNA-binding protein